MKTQLNLKSKSVEDLEAEYTLDNLVSYFDENDKRSHLLKVVEKALITKDTINVRLVDGKGILLSLQENPKGVVLPPSRRQNMRKILCCYLEGRNKGAKDQSYQSNP